MLLQSKKLNQPLLPSSIAGVFLLSLIYWLYLALTTHMDIACDSIGYESLGQVLTSKGWVSYLTTGPNREPLYPLLIASSMTLGHLTGFAYVRIMAIFGVIIMALTQALTYKILRLLNIRNSICILILAYLALSPALNNSAFSLYSEISTLPFILGIVLASFYAWEAIAQNKILKAYIFGALLGLLLVAATFIKAVFECVAPAFLIILFLNIFLAEKKKVASSSKIIAFILCLTAAVSFYYVPVTDYKWLNLYYNGNFVVTNRGPLALYGDTTQRTEPLTFKKFTEDLAYIPGEGFCNSIFGAKECDFWSFQKADEFGLSKQEELNRRHLSLKKINNALISLSAQKALHHPFQYTLMTFIQGLKMFFWESTQVGFVGYPHWLQTIYDIKILNNGLRFLLSLLSLIAVLSLWRTKLSPGSPIGFLIGILIFLYILFFSFFSILTRYALPIAPLYLISIGVWLNQNLPPKKQFKL